MLKSLFKTLIFFAILASTSHVGAQKVAIEFAAGPRYSQFYFMEKTDLTIFAQDYETSTNNDMRIGISVSDELLKGSLLLSRNDFRNVSHKRGSNLELSYYVYEILLELNLNRVKDNSFTEILPSIGIGASLWQLSYANQSVQGIKVENPNTMLKPTLLVINGTVNLKTYEFEDFGITPYFYFEHTAQRIEQIRPGSIDSEKSHIMQFGVGLNLHLTLTEN
jgi:hypothetical protein